MGEYIHFKPNHSIFLEQTIDDNYSRCVHNYVNELYFPQLLAAKNIAITFLYFDKHGLNFYIFSNCYNL